MIQHRVAEVKYHHGTNGDDAPLTCFCGWYGKAGDFATHRREAMADRDIRNSAGALGPNTGSSWVRVKGTAP